MANVLTGLIPDLYVGIDKVLREQVGFIPAVGMNLSSVPVAINEDIVIPVTRAATASDFTPTMVPTNPAAVTVDNVKLAITKSRVVRFGIAGEEQRGLDNGPGSISVQADMIAQAVRTLVNEIETDLANTAYLGSNRSYGTAGTTPFASNLTDAAQIIKMAKDNGAPSGDMHLIIDTNAGVNIRSLTQLTNVDQAASTSLLRQGLLTAAPIFDLNIRETGQAVSHVAGAGTGYLANGISAVGATSIPVDTGSGTVLAGDYVTFAGDTNKYNILTGISAPGTIVIPAPGLLQEVASATAMIVGDSYTSNVAFDRSAIQLVARPPIKPREGDLRIDSTIITDPFSGLSFEVSVWPGIGMVEYKIGLSWGTGAIKPESIFTLLG